MFYLGYNVLVNIIILNEWFILILNMLLICLFLENFNEKLLINL